VPFIDATAAFSLRELAGALQRRGGRLLLSDVGARVRVDLERHGLIEDLGSDAMHASLAQALAAAVHTSN
jgi:anti-anti-sigma regulatory factor